MALKKTQLLDVTSVTGIATVGILTVGVTPTAGGVGVASTTYLKGVIAHSTGLSTSSCGLYIYPDGVEATGYAHTAYRLLKIDISPNETYFFETPYPIVMTSGNKLVVEINASAASVGGLNSGIGTAINFQVLGDTDI